MLKAHYDARIWQGINLELQWKPDSSISQMTEKISECRTKEMKPVLTETASHREPDMRRFNVLGRVNNLREFTSRGRNEKEPDSHKPPAESELLLRGHSQHILTLLQFQMALCSLSFIKRELRSRRRIWRMRPRRQEGKSCKVGKKQLETEHSLLPGVS